MKKILVLFLCSLMLLSLAACGKAQPAGPNITQVAMETGKLQYYFMTGDGAIVSDDKYRTRWGDSCLLAFPDGTTMLIDTGVQGFYPILKQSLYDLHITELDYVVLSHAHNDHMGGIQKGLLTDFKVGQVYYNGTENTAWEETVASKCEKANVPLTVWKAGDEIQLGAAENPVNVKVLWPTEEAMAQIKDVGTVASINSLSLVLRLDFGEHSALFTGDIYQARNSKNMKFQVDGFDGAEELLLEGWQKDYLDVDLLKLAHHGNPQTSSSMYFINAVSPETAVATSYEAVGVYLSFYKSRGLTCPVYFDRINGNIQIQAGADGTMDVTVERTDYLEGFAANWVDMEKNKES